MLKPRILVLRFHPSRSYQADTSGKITETVTEHPLPRVCRANGLSVGEIAAVQSRISAGSLGSPSRAGAEGWRRRRAGAVGSRGTRRARRGVAGGERVRPGSHLPPGPGLGAQELGREDGGLRQAFLGVAALVWEGIWSGGWGPWPPAEEKVFSYWDRKVTIDGEPSPCWPHTVTCPYYSW